MSTLAEIKALAAQAAQTGKNMTEVVKGGGGARLLPEGYAFGRLVEYVELGKQPQEFNGKAKDPALEVQLAFALWGDARGASGNVVGAYHNDDGSPYIIRMFPFALSQNDGSRAFKMFKSLNWKGTCTHYAQMVGEPVLVKIIHAPKSKTDPTLVSRVDPVAFLPPLDPVHKQPYAIPAAPESAYRLFLWDYPTKTGWDALFEEGKWDDGKSKNRVQETCIGALDFEGSALQQLLLANGVQALPTAPALPVAAAALPSAPAAPVAPTAPVVAAAVPLAVPVAAAVSASPALPGIPASPAIPSAIPAGLPTTCPSE